MLIYYIYSVGGNRVPTTNGIFVNQAGLKEVVMKTTISISVSLPPREGIQIQIQTLTPTQTQTWTRTLTPTRTQILTQILTLIRTLIQ